MNVVRVERRILFGNLLITDSDSERYNIPKNQSIQLDISQLIIGDDFKKITSVESTFDVLYPCKIEKPFSIVEVKDYASNVFLTGESRAKITMDKKELGYMRPEPRYITIQRPNQVWDISKNKWIIVRKPCPRDLAWSWNEDNLTWDCPKNEETGELMKQDRTGMTNCWPPNSEIRVATYHSKKKE
jgi:hypothetical protein